jgi:NAD(P)-dependent dehydrogenase (short-subunit alcohol dehydrogenase family)
MRLHDLVVMITGCSSGIGLALSEVLLQAGHRVVATARRPERLAIPTGPGVLIQRLDVTDSESIGSAVAAAVAWSGRIDMLINNAGYGLIGPLAELELEALRLQMETNVIGQIAVTQAVIPYMIEQGQGRIVNIGSISGVITTPFAGAYCASKAALHMLGDALRMELAPLGIEVVTVQAGAVVTGFAEAAAAGLGHYREQGSRYRQLADRIEERARLSEQKGISADDFARQVVDVVTRRRPPAVVRIGRGTWLLPVFSKLPVRLLDRFLKQKFGLDHLQP